MDVLIVDDERTFAELLAERLRLRGYAVRVAGTAEAALEQMDRQTLSEFGAWLEGEGLQVIATRVSTGEECAIIIEDGLAQGTPAAPQTNKFTEGGF